ncbi:hypothetical protein Q2T40_21605 [Winogradskyella maritima]|nr:hypothetical protein [Winogradskyella maritima]
MAEKYKEVMDSMARVQTMLDKRMLALFNPKQYQLYQSLCKEASRSPFLVEPRYIQIVFTIKTDAELQ